MADTYEVPSVEDAKEEASGAVKPMLEGAAGSVGIELGGAVMPVAGEALGGLLASFVTTRESGKTYVTHMAGYKAVERLLA